MILIYIIFLADLQFNHIVGAFSLIMGIIVGLLQLYVTMRQAKLKEEMLEIMRKEINNAIEKMESKMVTHNDMRSLRENLELMFKNIKLEIESGYHKANSEKK